MAARPPPLQTLRAFEAAGRLLSMALAAQEMNVTPGAISRQIQTLEDDLGVALFRRMTRRIALTEEGVGLHQVVSRALAELTREAERLRAEASPMRFLRTCFCKRRRPLSRRGRRISTYFFALLPCALYSGKIVSKPAPDAYWSDCQ